MVLYCNVELFNVRARREAMSDVRTVLAKSFMPSFGQTFHGKAANLSGKSQISRRRSSRLRVKKKRRPGLYRAVPVPATLLDALDLVHGLRDRATRTYLWTWSLKTAYTRVIEIMARAGIAGPQASPKGLRHGFGVACIEKGIPLNLVQRWLGHAQLSTTAIYADAVGEEERHIAARLWT